MKAEDLKELEEVRVEHNKQILERYKNVSKNFQRLLSSLIGFALIFPFIILFPYISVQYDKKKIEEQLENISVDISERHKSLEAYKEVKDKIQSLMDEINKLPMNLRDFIKKTLQSHPESEGLLTNPQLPTFQGPDPSQWHPPAPSQLPGGPAPRQWPHRADYADQAPVEPNHRLTAPGACASFEGEERVNCLVKQKVLSYFRKYEDILRKDVKASLQNLKNISDVPMDLTKLEEGLDNLQESFKKELTDNPRFWETYEGKLGLSIKLSAKVEQFRDDFEKVVEGQSKKIEKEYKNLQVKQENLEKEKTELEVQKDVVAKRLSQIETPVGKIPVGLNESVLLFPVILAIGFLICTSLFCETTFLYMAIGGLLQK